jgi:hypothetical protein
MGVDDSGVKVREESDPVHLVGKPEARVRRVES